jgi:flagella basal body P-ring formation protein FlgA
VLRLLLILVLIPSLAGADVSATLRPTVSVAADRATLDDVAELTGDQQAIAVLGGLTVVELPDLKPRRLDATAVRMAIGNGLGQRLAIAGECVVARRGIDISEEDQVAAAKAVVASAGDEVTVSLLRVSGALLVPDGGLPVRLLAEALDRHASGDIPFRIRVLRGEVELARSLVTLRIVRHRMQPVAARAIRRGEIIGAADLRAERVQVTRTSGIAGSDDGFIGREARVDLAEGTPLAPSLVVVRPDIRVGQAVQLLVSTERFHLTAPGEALGDGRIGEVIPVRRNADGKTVRGTVVAAGQVRLDR